MLDFFKHPAADGPLTSADFVFAGLEPVSRSCEALDSNIRERLHGAAARVKNIHESVTEGLRNYLRQPQQADVSLAVVAQACALDPVEILAVRLAIAADQDLLAGHLLSQLQQPLPHSRPTIGLIAQAYAPENTARAVYTLGQGNAVRCGLLEVIGEELPLPERQLRVPLATALALEYGANSFPGTAHIPASQAAMPLGATANRQAGALAKRLGVATEPGYVLTIRSGDISEARAAAAQVAALCSASAVLVQTEQVTGLGPWLILANAFPVFEWWLAPGERRTAPSIPGYHGPLLLLTGPEGNFESRERVVLDWQIETPNAAERKELWQTAIGEGETADRLARDHRHSAGRIAALAAKAREDWLVENPGDAASVYSYAPIRAISRGGDSTELDALAELIPDEVGDEALVVTDALRAEMNTLVTRCRLREQFTDSLGPSILARYRPSVRALFVGPSGTGKTLAASWLASQLGLPLYRVDLAAITSKYIGETEKNLSQLLARAEQNEVLLLFDEADSLFGKRTDIRDSNDRFANAQTNYLLQRMESYDGITVLTSNGRNRFDDAFSRRFDAILTFPLPGPEERRRLWQAHLGANHAVTSPQVNLLSAMVELSGGQIRNAVLRAAVEAASEKRSIEYPDLIGGVAAEYRKLSRQLPNELRVTQNDQAGARRG